VLYVVLDYNTGKTKREEIVRYNSSGMYDKIVYSVTHQTNEMETQNRAEYIIQGMCTAENGIRIVIAKPDKSMELMSINPAGEVLVRSDLDVYTMSAMIVSGNMTIVADQARNEILLTDQTGHVEQRFGTTGTAMGKFRSPASICTDKLNNIFVCDRGNRRIQKFDSKGAVSLIFNNPAPVRGARDFDLRSITVAGNELYVTEFLGNRIIVFNDQGHVVREIRQLDGPLTGVSAQKLFTGLGILAIAAAVVILFRLALRAYRQRLAVRLIILFSFTGVIIVCAVSLLVYSISRKNYEKEVREKYMMLAQMLAAQVDYETVARIDSVDDDKYQELLTNFKMAVTKSSNIDWIGIYLVEGERLYYGIDTDESGIYTPVFRVSPQHNAVLKGGQSGYFEYEDETGQYLAAVAPVTDSTGAVKTILEVSCDLGFLTQYSKAVIYNVLWVSLLCVVIFCCISILVSLTITQPVNALTLGAQAVEQGRYDYRLESKHRHEVGRFISTFNEMMQSLSEKEKIRSIMDKVVSKEVAHELLQNKMELGGVERRVSILFTDIRGFTTIAENMEPSNLVQMLNDFFSRMSPIIEKESGVIDKYIGDSIMAIFGAPVEFPDDAMRAVRAGAAVLTELRAFNAGRARLGLQPINIGIGINCGKVVAGNIGSKSRLNYTIIGDEVNLASRLEGLTKYYEVEMIVSEEVADRVRDKLFLRELDMVRVKGKTGGGRIFQVVTGQTEKLAEIFKIYEHALALYRSRQWNAAEEKFKKVLTALPDDKPSLIFMDRINEFKKDPPLNDWDGVHSIPGK
jgi:class 3 adenylate cyclase